MSVSAIVVGVAVASVVVLLAGGSGGRASVVRDRFGALEQTSGRSGRVCVTATLRQVSYVSAGGLRELGRTARRAVRRPPDPTRELPAGAALVLGVMAAVVLGVLPGTMVATGLLVASWWWERRRPHREEAEVRAVLPDVVDLFRLSVGAGLSVHEALEMVAPRALGPVGASLREVRRRVGLGVRLGDALSAMDELGDPARPLQSALAAAARYGSPLGPALDRVVVDARMQRRRRAEEHARRLPVKLLLPLVLCVLPAFGLLAVVPLLAGSLPALTSGP